MGVTFVLFYYKHGIKDQTSIQDAEGAIFLMIVEMIFQYAYYMVFGQNERSIVLKEVNDGLYAIGPYYLSQMILKVNKTEVIICYIIRNKTKNISDVDKNPVENLLTYEKICTFG